MNDGEIPMFDPNIYSRETLQERFPNGLIQHDQNTAEVNQDGRTYYYIFQGNSYIPFTFLGIEISDSISSLDFENNRITFLGTNFSFDSRNGEISTHEGYPCYREKWGQGEKITRYSYENFLLQELDIVYEFEGEEVIIKVNGEKVAKDDLGEIHFGLVNYRGQKVDFHTSTGEIKTHNGLLVRINNGGIVELYRKEGDELYRKEGDELKPAGLCTYRDGEFIDFSLNGEDVNHLATQVIPDARFVGGTGYDSKTKYLDRNASYVNLGGERVDQGIGHEEEVIYRKYNPETGEILSEGHPLATWSRIQKRPITLDGRNISASVTGPAYLGKTITFKGKKVYFNDEESKIKTTEEGLIIGPVWEGDRMGRGTINGLYKNSSQGLTLVQFCTGEGNKPLMIDGKEVFDELELKDGRIHYKGKVILFDKEGNIILENEDGEYIMPDGNGGGKILIYQDGDYKRQGICLITEKGVFPITINGEKLELVVPYTHITIYDEPRKDTGAYGCTEHYNNTKHERLSFDSQGRIIKKVVDGRDFFIDETCGYYFYDNATLVDVFDDDLLRRLESLPVYEISEVIEDTVKVADSILE